MNLRMVSKYLGFLVLAEAGFLLPSILVAILYGEHRPLSSLLITAGLCLGLGLLLELPAVLRRRRQTVGADTIYAREGFVVAGAGWLVVSLLGALPFYISGEIPDFINAFFESASGFTTTGASILANVEAMSRSLLFWRSFTHWMGGIGVLAFILAVVRSKAGAGFSLHLMRAETPGPQKGKMLPRVHNSVRGLFLVYGTLSALNLAFLLLGGMPVFDAFCTMFGTAGTGGFGIKADSMASYSPYIQTVTTVFMALFGVNFALYFLLLRRQWRAALRDQELWLYMGIMAGATALITLSLTLAGFGGVGESLHHGAFTVSSIMTTTGFATVDFNTWPQFARTLILLLMFCGAMAGGTGGGFKTARVLILIKSMRGGFHRLLHPNSVSMVRINGKTVDDGVLNRVYLYLATYCALVLGGFLLLSLDGRPLEENFSAVVSCLNNIGPGLGAVGPVGNYSVYSHGSTLMLGLLMLIGRLELFPILLLALPGTWSRKN